ncbi:MAG: glutamate--tRNA ligase [bacterium]
MVRTRFAPSPTGHLHIGNARTAIMNWVFTKHTGGKFILRIEDTDIERSTRSSEQAIIKDLKWLGLDWDEGPESDGDHGPYYQSKRLEFYRKYAEELLKQGKAYECFCTAEELKKRREQRVKAGKSAIYDRRCLHLTQEEKGKLRKEERKPSIRFYVDEDISEFEDIIKGTIDFREEEFGDFILMRSDGMPMYNFSCVIDDHLMNITHIIRGDDHVSNTPRQILIYRALGWEVPEFAHIPMIFGPDKTRLSKRHGATSVSQFREQGYVPESLINFLSRLSWSSESGDEILSRERLIREFDFKRVSQSPAVFDQEKLDWMNGVYIRKMSKEEFYQAVRSFFQKSEYADQPEEVLKRVAAILQEKVERLNQVVGKARIFFQDNVVPENEEAKAILNTPEARKVISGLLKELQKADKFNGQVFLNLLKNIQKSTGIKGKHLWMPVRVALTGQMHGPNLTDVVEILGKTKCIYFLKMSNTE